MALLRCDGDLVTSIATCVGGVSVNGQLGVARRNKNLLVIGSLVDEDALGSRGSGRKRVDRRLDGTELASLLDRDTSTGCSSSAGSQHRSDEVECCKDLHCDV